MCTNQFYSVNAKTYGCVGDGKLLVHNIQYYLTATYTLTQPSSTKTSPSLPSSSQPSSTQQPFVQPSFTQQPSTQPSSKQPSPARPSWGRLVDQFLRLWQSRSWGHSTGLGQEVPSWQSTVLVKEAKSLKSSERDPSSGSWNKIMHEFSNVSL